MKKRKLFHVKWHDACVDTGWASDKGKSIGIAECETIGWLVRSNQKEVVLASTRSGKETNARIAIPADWIQNITEVKLG